MSRGAQALVACIAGASLVALLVVTGDARRGDREEVGPADRSAGPRATARAYYRAWKTGDEQELCRLVLPDKREAVLQQAPTAGNNDVLDESVADCVDATGSVPDGDGEAYVTLFVDLPRDQGAAVELIWSAYPGDEDIGQPIALWLVEDDGEWFVVRHVRGYADPVDDGASFTTRKDLLRVLDLDKEPGR